MRNAENQPSTMVSHACAVLKLRRMVSASACQFGRTRIRWIRASNRPRTRSARTSQLDWWSAGVLTF